MSNPHTAAVPSADPIVYVVFLNPDGSIKRQYWADHANPADRRTLGTDCFNAFREGVSVLTAPVEKIGDKPTWLGSN